MNSVFGAIAAATAKAWSNGRTTAQMKAAPENALYVWPDDLLVYPVQLARHLGRGDLRIKPARALANAKYLSCMRPPAMVIDHAVVFTSSIDEAVAYAKKRDIPVFTKGGIP